MLVATTIGAASIFYLVFAAIGWFEGAFCLLLFTSTLWTGVLVAHQALTIRRSFLLALYSLTCWLTLWGWAGSTVAFISPWGIAATTTDDRLVPAFQLFLLVVLSPLAYLAVVGVLRQLNKTRDECLAMPKEQA